MFPLFSSNRCSVFVSKIPVWNNRRRKGKLIFQFIIGAFATFSKGKKMVDRLKVKGRNKYFSKKYIIIIRIFRLSKGLLDYF